MQSGRIAARATLVRSRPSVPPAGGLWTSDARFPDPPETDETIAPYVGSDDAGWTRSPAEHQNESRKRFYNDGIRVVAGEPNSPFVRAATVAEATSW